LRRRQFITLIGGAAAWPLAATAQQPAMPVIGLLSSTSPDSQPTDISAFHRGLGEAGYVEGRNVAVEYRWAEGHYDRLPALAADLVGRQVTVIATGPPVASAQAAKAATTTIPIVFATGADPIKFGLVASLNRPGGNVTGVSFVANALLPKLLDLLRKLVPRADPIGLLVNPNNPNADFDTKDAQAAAQTLRVQLIVQGAASERDFETAFATFEQQRIGALLLVPDTFFLSQSRQIAALALRQRIPVIGDVPEEAVAGALMSYGANLADSYRQVGAYVGRILKGAKPADLPVVQPTKFELVINLKTAKTLGLTVPPSLLAIADEVIE
jgi:putative ABC transport system substrate-binding protein